MNGELLLQLGLLRRGVDQLSAILRGEIVTHPALPGTEMYLVSVLLRMIRLMLDCGYSERVNCIFISFFVENWELFWSQSYIFAV